MRRHSNELRLGVVRSRSHMKVLRWNRKMCRWNPRNRCILGTDRCILLLWSHLRRREVTMSNRTGLIGARSCPGLRRGENNATMSRRLIHVPINRRPALLLLPEQRSAPRRRRDERSHRAQRRGVRGERRGLDARCALSLPATGGATTLAKNALKERRFVLARLLVLTSNRPSAKASAAVTADKMSMASSGASRV